jgi:hypothetical protein
MEGRPKNVNTELYERELHQAAEERAQQQRAIVDDRTLRRAIDQYIEWEALVLWVRAIVTAERTIPETVAAEVKARCPGLVENLPNPESCPTPPDRLLWPDIMAWMEDVIFVGSKQAGWFDAVTYYARRDERLRRFWDRWYECKVAWSASRPSRYPTFPEWLGQ